FMIHKGRKVLDGTLQSIRETYGSDTVRVRIEGNHTRLDDLPAVIKVTDFGQWKELRLQRGGDAQRLLQALAARGRICHFELAQPSLHDIFVRIAEPGGDRHA